MNLLGSLSYWQNSKFLYDVKMMSSVLKVSHYDSYISQIWEEGYIKTSWLLFWRIRGFLRQSAQRVDDLKGGYFGKFGKKKIEGQRGYAF